MRLLDRTMASLSLRSDCQGMVVGKGVYYDTHHLIHLERRIIHECLEWKWAGLDGKRFIWVEKGALFKSQVTSKGVGSARKLHDFNDLRDLKSLWCPTKRTESFGQVRVEFKEKWFLRRRRRKSSSSY
ncbi:MAG: hypothetical protein M2R46_02487 [Verrucomicrobia subdivision 3 bacterium]|nr:hypothetical protein [Limisphaerales bacterium]